MAESTEFHPSPAGRGPERSPDSSMLDPQGGNLTSNETVDIENRQAPLPIIEDVTAFIQHLDDACPLITSDPDEAMAIKARYVIGDEIGSGSIGQVINAFDEHLLRNIAIKILHNDASMSKERISRFIAEAQITAQLEHPSIPPVYEIGQMPGGMPYFAMKKVRGESLEDVINNLRVGDEDYQNRYSKERIVRSFTRICQGLAYAHARGVVHRDLKPGNIMIGEFGVVQIMDWGLAKVMGDSRIKGINAIRTVRDTPELRTMDGAIAGTPAYMSPEQARGDVDKVSPASDIYSLGLIFAEFLTLKRVFRDNKPVNTIEQVRSAESIDVFELSPDSKIDPELAGIVRKCTQSRPSNRYLHAGELVEDLFKYLDHAEISAHQDTGQQKVVKWSRRNPVLAGVLLGISITLMTLAVSFHWLKPFLIE